MADKTKPKYDITYHPEWGNDERCGDGRNHEPDMHSITPADGADGVVDVSCKHCGRSGSAKLVPSDFCW